MPFKEDILVALGQGSRLLESINEPVMRDPDHNMNQDELENLATVQRSVARAQAQQQDGTRTQTALDTFIYMS